jgi:hypothetical protein
MSTFTACAITVNTIQSLSDNPNTDDGLSSAQLKAKFDQVAVDIKAYINNSLIPDFVSVAQTMSGAKKIGLYTVSGLSAANVQDAIQEIVTAGLGGLPADGSITDAKLGSDVKVGSLLNLSTSNKVNIVGAINEVVAKEASDIIDLGGTGRTTETIKSAYDLANSASGNLTTHIADTTKHINILTSRGDLLRRGLLGVERYAIGASGKVLSSDGVDAKWDWPLYDILGTASGSGASKSLTITGLGTVYKCIKIFAKIRTDYSTDPYDTLFCRINGDSTTNYISQLITFNGSSIGGYKGTNNGFLLGNINCGHANSLADSFTDFEVDFNISNETDNLKTVLFKGQSAYATGSLYTWNGYGYHTVIKDYITSIAFSTVGNIISGSKIVVYGIK